MGRPAAPSLITGADLAQAALAVAAEAPATRRAIELLLEREAPPTYGVVTATLAVTAALAILQTEVTFERTPGGKWKVKLHKKAASDALLKALAHAVMRAVGGGEETKKDAPRLPK